MTAHGDLRGFSPPGVALQTTHHEPWSPVLLSGLWTRAEIPGQLGTRLGDGRGRTHPDAGPGRWPRMPGPGRRPHDGRKATQTQTRTHCATGVSVATWRLVKPPPTLEVAEVKNSNYIIKTVLNRCLNGQEINESARGMQTLCLYFTKDGTRPIGGSPVYSPASTYLCRKQTRAAHRAAPLGGAGGLAPSYLAPGLSSAVLGQTGCTRSSSCGSRIPVSPTALWGQEVSASASYRVPNPKRHAVCNTSARWHWAGIFKLLVFEFQGKPMQSAGVGARASEAGRG